MEQARKRREIARSLERERQDTSPFDEATIRKEKEQRIKEN